MLDLTRKTVSRLFQILPAFFLTTAYIPKTLLVNIPMQNQLRTTELEEKTKMLTDQQDVIHAFIHVSPITPEPKPALQDHPTLLQ